MYSDEFAARLRQLEDPYTDAQTRHAVDRWLTQFRDNPHAWLTAQSALALDKDPSLWPHAAQILSYKCKHQLAQIEAIEQRIALLQTLLTALATLTSSLPSTSTATATASRAVTQGLCVAISNLILQIPTLPVPLQTLGSLLNQQTMLEFLTVLPGECEDAYQSLQASADADASEAAFLLKQRAGEWCIEVGAWLYNVLNSVVQSDSQLAAFLSPAAMAAPPGPSSFSPFLVPCISCFAAWIKWGGLFFMAQEHWEYMLRLSSGFLLTTTSISSSNASGSAAGVAAAGVEAISEAIERPAPATQRILLEITLRISQHICTAFPLGSTSTNFNLQYRHMTHVFTTYCSTNANSVASATPEGAVLRNGLLHLVALAGEKATGSGVGSGGGGGGHDLESINFDYNDEDEDEEEESSGGVPAVDALGDVLEAIVDPSLSSPATSNIRSRSINEGDIGDVDEDGNVHLLSGQERIQFTSTILSVLLQYSQVPPQYLLGNLIAARDQYQQKHEGVVWLPRRLKNYRTQAEWPLWLCGEILLANAFIQQLYSFFQSRSTTTSTMNMTGSSTNLGLIQRASTSPTGVQALEVCFYAITKGASGAFSEDNADTGAWVGPLLSLFAAAQELDPCKLQNNNNPQTTVPPTTPQLSIFHFNLLSAFTTVAKPLMKAIASMPEQCQGLMKLIFNLSEAAISANTTSVLKHTSNFEDQIGMETENEHSCSVVEAAAQAVRATLSSPREVQAMALAAGAVEAIDTMLSALITTGTNLQSSPYSSSTADAGNMVNSVNSVNDFPYRSRDLATRKASQELIVALVHALYAADQQYAARAQDVLRNRALQPLITIAAAAADFIAKSNSLEQYALSPSQYASSLVMHFSLLHGCLEDVIALLNALESHIDSSGGEYLQQNQQGQSVVGAAVNDAVAACLTAWPNIMTALSQASSALAGSSATTSTSSISNISALIYQDASQCLCSCIHLSPGSITPSVSPLLESLISTFFLPGGHSMHRILCALLETNLSTTSTLSPVYYINTLVTATGSLLTAPAAQKFYVLGGGDQEPDAACAVLTIATCLLRQASSTQWNIVMSTADSANTGVNTNACINTNQSGVGGVVVVGPLVECVNLALRLSAANAACNHRGVCQRAIATLSAAIVLILDSSCTALHSPLLQVACSTNLSSTMVLDSTNSTVSSGTGGVVIMQGILLCLLSLHSTCFLPKIVNLISEVSTLAVEVCCFSVAQGGSDLASLTRAAASVLQAWWNTAKLNLEMEGTRVTETGGAAAAVAAAVKRESNILNLINWEPLVAAAAAARIGNENAASNVLEAKRSIQRAVRQVAEQIRKSHG